MHIPARHGVRQRRSRALLCLLLALVCVACGGQPGRREPEPRDPGRLRIASFDFPESRVLAELYAHALRQAGFEVEVLSGLGTREIVAPAMQQGLVDLVVDYSGSLLDHLGGSVAETHRTPQEVHRTLRQAGFEIEVLSGLGTREIVAPALQQGMVDLVVDYSGSLLDHLGGSVAETHGTPQEVHRTLRPRLAGRGLTALAYAPAEDVNAFAVRADFARAHQLSKLSDLRELAGRLTFGAPPECPARRYCLQGLQDTYGLRFAAFRPQPSRGATATALDTGEIDVGLLETTYGRLGDRPLTLLIDDLNLQPRENLVPVVRTEVVQRYGTRLTEPLDALSARLTTGDLVRLNHIVAVNPLGPAEAVAAYVRRFGP